MLQLAAISGPLALRRRFSPVLPIELFVCFWRFGMSWKRRSTSPANRLIDLLSSSSATGCHFRPFSFASLSFGRFAHLVVGVSCYTYRLIDTQNEVNRFAGFTLLLLNFVPVMIQKMVDYSTISRQTFAPKDSSFLSISEYPRSI